MIHSKRSRKWKSCEGHEGNGRRRSVDLTSAAWMTRFESKTLLSDELSLTKCSSSRHNACTIDTIVIVVCSFIPAHPSSNCVPVFFFYVQFTRLISFAATHETASWQKLEEKLIPLKVCVKSINTQGIEETISWQSKHPAVPRERCLLAVCQSLSYATPRCARLPISFWGIHHPMANVTPTSA
jgi:hypothetical protein